MPGIHQNRFEEQPRDHGDALQSRVSRGLPGEVDDRADEVPGGSTSPACFLIY